MRIKKYINIVFFFFIIGLSLTSCSNEELDSTEEIPDVGDDLGTDAPIDSVMPNPNPTPDTIGKATFFNESLTSNDYILVNDAKNNFVYLMDKKATTLHQWNLGANGDLGNDCFLESDGTLLAMLESDNTSPELRLGGYGGKIHSLDKNGNIIWQFEYSSENHVLHHDALTLPNGNVLAMIWERKSLEEVSAKGYDLEVELFPDGLIEIERATKEIVWEWHLWDHTIQDGDETKLNYGSVNSNPQLVDLNYNQREDGDISHGNGITYDPEKDIIYFSANFYSEIWVIDHSTSSAEAAGHTGGNYGKGGDLIYRFGNPKAYGNNQGKRLFHNNHHPNLFSPDDYSKMLVFSNGAELEQSTVYELRLPDEFSLNSDLDNEPEVLWSFADSDLYSPKVSGATRLSNGNTLITEGDFGIWEVTSSGEVVWKFEGDGFFWRAYPYDKNAEEILILGL
ncbi:hypothetical protein FGM00_13500 [Aggregatimonas sangjinii]|uniref:Arylsulfotransferase ASST n=1 Tax=Aggregatimonas sangjinii TaxID=2583587 RepID=A0A5B7SWF7_9FLAO|nr:aryl-sulfate sulfotransferase [Aggregatimonas sangjinii]QCX01080.1 hypothetical protein FGM00_13500 [Aggregatimonas sangjinii]